MRWPHFGQVDGGCARLIGSLLLSGAKLTSDSSICRASRRQARSIITGRRRITTFRKLPISSEKIVTAATNSVRLSCARVMASFGGIDAITLSRALSWVRLQPDACAFHRRSGFSRTSGRGN